MTEAGKEKLVGKEVAPPSAQVVDTTTTGSLRLIIKAEHMEAPEPPVLTESNIEDDQ